MEWEVLQHPWHGLSLPFTYTGPSDCIVFRVLVTHVLSQACSLNLEAQFPTATAIYCRVNAVTGSLEHAFP